MPNTIQVNTIWQTDSEESGGWDSPAGRWTMSQPERPFAKKWRPPADVRVQHKKKLSHLSEAEQACLRQTMIAKYQNEIKCGIMTWKKRGYDPRQTELHAQFNVENGWFWDYKSRLLHVCQACCCAHARVPLTQLLCMCLRQVTSTSGHLSTPGNYEQRRHVTRHHFLQAQRPRRLVAATEVRVFVSANVFVALWTCIVTHVQVRTPTVLKSPRANGDAGLYLHCQAQQQTFPARSRLVPRTPLLS